MGGGSTLERLMDGNARFAAGSPRAGGVADVDATRERRCEIAHDPHPIAAVLGCSDARVPPERIFDVELGDLFIVRSAGHLATSAAVGSLELAVRTMGISLVVVLGHRCCSAVRETVEHECDGVPPMSPSVGAIIGGCTPAVRAAVDAADGAVDREALIEASIEEHVRRTAARVRTAIHDDGMDTPGLEVVGAVYDVDDGRVRIVDRVPAVIRTS